MRVKPFHTGLLPRHSPSLAQARRQASIDRAKRKSAWLGAMAPQSAPVPDWPDDRFEDVATCLWCGGRDAVRVVDGVEDWFFGAVPGEFAYARCQACAALLLERRPRAEYLPAAYHGYYTHCEPAPAAAPAGWPRRAMRALEQGYARRRYARSAAVADRAAALALHWLPVRRGEVDAQHRHLPQACGAILDYGCGNGAFLAHAAALGHSATGVDFDPQAIAFAGQGGLAVHLPEAMAQARFDGQFDHVTAAHVLEHVADPLALLRDFRRWLRPGGSVFIELPNAQAAGLAVR
jgi:hypothetical protein